MELLNAEVITPKEARDMYEHYYPEKSLRNTTNWWNNTNIKSYPTNCRNCGAVLHSNKCEYCGTEY